jgi:hypothetical protein
MFILDFAPLRDLEKLLIIKINNLLILITLKSKFIKEG